MKKRLLSLVLAALICVPVMTPPASALAASKYTYRLRISTRNESNAGTNATIRGGFRTYNDGLKDANLDDPDVDDFEKGDTNNFYIGLNIYPWMIQKLYVKQTDNAGLASDWKPGNVEAWAPTMGAPGSASIKISSSHYIGGTWDGGDSFETDISSYTKRNFTSLGTFDSWGQTIYLDGTETGSLNLTWNGNVTDQYGTYNIYACDDGGSFSISTSCNNSSTSYFNDNFVKPSSNTSAKLNLSYKNIYNEMVKKGIGRVTLTFTMTIPARSSNAGSLFTASGNNLVHTETVTIYRQCFNLGNTSYSETPVYAARQDNNYLNRSKKNVTITVSPTSIHCNSSMSDSDIKQLVSNFSCNAILCSGNSTTDKITDLTYKPSSDGKKIVFTGTVPNDFTTGTGGVNLVLTNVSTKYNSNVYKLDSGSANWNSYISTLKVDTVAPSVSITDKDAIPLDITNNLSPAHTFFLSGSETLYKQLTSPHNGEDEAYVIYSLYDGDTKVTLTNYDGGKGTYVNVAVPIVTSVMPDMPITLKTAEPSEGVYTLGFEGYDEAGNPIANSRLENVLIDSVAPRYILTENIAEQDAQYVKHIKYDFTLDDICNRYRDTLASYARLYYVFVPSGEVCPELDTKAISGEIDTTVGKWNFVEADSEGKLPTITISLKLEESFNGDLYLYSEDSVGNATEITKYLSNLELYNYKTTDTIVSEENSVSRKSFDISFTETVDGIDGIYSTEYRWVPASYDAVPLTQGYIEYDGQDVGAAIQYGDDGEPVTLNGTYRLEYKVTEIRSKNTETFSRNYIFDNLPPVIDLAWVTENKSPLQLQQANIVITDVSGVASASYAVYTDGGKLVSEGTLTPATGGDGKLAVRESIKLQPQDNGVYRIEVYSVDVNGDEITYDTAESFAIRAIKPQIASAGDDISVKLDGISVTNSNEYTVYLQVMEDMICAEELAKDQVVKYSVSADGINFGPWVILEEPMDVSKNHLSINAEIENPLTLTEGKNRLYFKVACAEVGNTADPAASLISDVYAYDIIYDTTAPTFRVEYSTYDPTNEDVTVTVTAQEANGVTSLTEDSKYISAEKESDIKYILTVSRNVDTDVVLSDAVGNEVDVPVVVSCIDKVAPVITADSEELENGARTDAVVTVAIEDRNTVSTRFGLIEDPTSDSEVTEDAFALFEMNKSKFSIEKSERNGITEYTVTLRGLDGTFGVAVESTDLVGNKTLLFANDTVFTAIDAEAEITNCVSDPEITKSTATVTLDFNVPLFVLNPALALGGSDEENEAIALAQADKVFVNTAARTVTDTLEKKLYAVDEANRAYTLTFASDSTFIEGFKLSYTLYKNGDEIDNGSMIAFEKNDDAQLVIESNPIYELQTFDITDMVLSGYEFNEDESEVYVKPDAKAEDTEAPKEPAEDESVKDEPVEDEPVVYQKLVFDALHDGSVEKSVSFVSYTAEGLESDRYQNETVITSLFDETVPTAVFTPSADNDTPTNKNVTVEVVFGDAESGISSVTRVIDDEETELGAKSRDSVEFSENGSVTYIITNNAGMTDTVTYRVKNIDKTPIEEGEHYTVEYFYENYRGNWKPIEDGKFYRAVKAVVNFEDCDKELSVSNNGTLTEAILTSEKKEFTFAIKDSAGNTTEKAVSYENYDNDGGTIKWTLSNYNKTNKPVTAFVSITDKENVNEIVHSEVRDSAGELYEWEDEVLGNEYRVTLPLSGIYTVTAYDAAGNAFSEQITVSNIDIVKPTITRLSYSTPPNSITTRSVLVKIEEFSKSNVTVTGIERSDELGEYDIVYTPGATEIRFKKSGYVSVFFIDDYGNENASVISVSNIYTAPPALEPVAELAADELSVDITFKKQLDETGMPIDIYRELTSLFVSFNGVTLPVAVQESEDDPIELTSFKIKKNGDYTFTIFDESGTSQVINVIVTDIDDRAPVIKTVSWIYDYMEESDGLWEKKTFEKTLKIGEDTSGTEAGYTVGPDVYHVTNSDVKVSIVTDKDASLLGSDDIKSKLNSLTYAENGLFTFNLQAINGTISSYGVEVAIIDKKPPTLTFEGADELIFIEGMTDGKDPDFAYDKSKFYDFIAYDIYENVRIELTDQVKIDFGDFNPDDINANVFDRTKPYYITYTVYDLAGNKAEYRRSVRLVGFYDTIALINGKMPNSANAIAIDTDDIVITLKNFAGTCYAKYAEGIYTMGQMKTMGTPIVPVNGEIAVRDCKEGWYTVFIQTDKRDYFTITVFVDSAD